MNKSVFLLPVFAVLALSAKAQPQPVPPVDEISTPRDPQSGLPCSGPPSFALQGGAVNEQKARAVDPWPGDIPEHVGFRATPLVTPPRRHK